MKTIAHSKVQDAEHMPFVTWLQILKAVSPRSHRHGISIGGKGWSIRGIIMMHLRLGDLRRGKIS
jgi:hypothetical protein